MTDEHEKAKANKQDGKIKEKIAEEVHQRKFGAQNNFTNFLRQDVVNQMSEERMINSKK